MRDGWTETTLGEVARWRKGKKPPQIVPDPSAGPPYLSALVLRGGSPEGFIPRDVVEQTLLSDEDGVLLLWDGAGAGDIFGSKLGIVSSTMSFIQPATEELLGSFLLLALQAEAPNIRAACRGTTVPHVSPDHLAALRVPLPPLVEQRHIVDVIESVDTYINALETRASTARTARSALLHELLSAGATHWPSIPFGQLLEIERGSSPRPISAFLTDREDGTNWIKIGDASASTKYIYSTARKITLEGFATPRFVKPGDFILSNSMSFGRPYIMRTHGCIHDGWMLLSEVDRNFDEDFLYNLLQSNQLQEKFISLAAGSGVRNLKIDSVKSIEVQLPPKEDQLEIAATMNSFDKLALSLETSLADARDLRSALLSDLLSGDHEIPESYDRFLGAA